MQVAPTTNGATPITGAREPLDLQELHRKLGSTGRGNSLHEGVEEVIGRGNTRSTNISHAGNHHPGNGGLDLGEHLRTGHQAE